MKPKIIARIVGATIILFNLWLIGQYQIEGVMVLVLTFGVAIAFELLIVRAIGNNSQGSLSASPSRDAPAPVTPPAAPLVEAMAAELPVSLPVAEEHWRRALEEFEGGSRRPGLWGKSFAEANGDEAIAKASYLQVRASELAQADWAAAREATLAAEAQRLAEKEAVRLAAQREYDAKLKGICPSCRQVILLDAAECSRCHATFGPDAVWHVHPLRGET